MNKQDIIKAYKNTGYNAQDLMKVLDREKGTHTASFDGSLKVYQLGELIVMVSTEGVEFFKPDNT